MKKPKTFKLQSNSKVKKFNLVDRRDKYKTKEWTRYRFAFLHYNPSCYVCGCKAVHVDHITSAVERPELFYNHQNHLPLCHSCHSYITVKFDRIKPQKLKEKLEFIESERKKNNIIIRVKVLPEKEA